MSSNLIAAMQADGVSRLVALDLVDFMLAIATHCGFMQMKPLVSQ